jgi:hypothetical protein
MNDESFRLSLHQGKQFNNYQNKIKKQVAKQNYTKEAFTQQQSNNNFNTILQTNINNSNKQDLTELEHLQHQFDDLLQQHASIKQKIDTSIDVIHTPGKNVYASQLITNPTATYVGCYNNNMSQSALVNAVPILNSTNSVNGFISNASSVYIENNAMFGSWAAFDQNPDTFWHSEISSQTSYNDASGVYEGMHQIINSNGTSISGEYLQISSSSFQHLKVLQYSLCPRIGYNAIRNPNSWYILGSKDNQWYNLDRQTNQTFISSSAKTYTIATPGLYDAYMIIIDRVGNSDQPSNKQSVQIAEWNLFTNQTLGANAAMQPTSNETFKNCQQYAVDNGYTYFGVQDIQSGGLAQCMVSNDIARTTMYGDASVNATAVPIWSSNTYGEQCTLSLTSEGQLVVYSSDKTLFASPNAPSECKKTYSVSNNVDSPYSDIGYFDNKSVNDCELLCNNNDACAGFAFNKSTNHSCWIKSNISLNYRNANNNRDIYTRNPTPKNILNCVFFAALLDDGNFCIYKGKDPSDNRGGIWCSVTNGKQKNTNPDWVASKGKYGRNYLKSGEGLVAGEWIGSNNGSIKLIMQTDGNVVLYASETSVGCSKDLNNTTYGNYGMNAVYKMNETGNINSLGKVAYVDSTNELHEYPNSFIGVSNEYQLYPNTDLPGNDITSISTNQSGCQTECNNNLECAAYVYQSPTNTCWLKNGAGVNKQKQTNNTTMLGVRKPTLKTKCNNNKIVDIDTIQYDKYKTGKNMDDQCIPSIISQADKDNYNAIKTKLALLGQEIITKMDALYSQNNKIYEQMNMNVTQFKQKMELYKNTNKIIKDNTIEGMRNLDMQDIDGMLLDTDLLVVQSNYNYAFWSILAIVIVIITINTMKN